MVIHNLQSLIPGAVIAAFFCLMPNSQCQNECSQFAKDILKETNPAKISLLISNNYVNFTNNPVCFIDANQTNKEQPQVKALQSAAEQAIAPARTSLWNVFESLSGSQQQGSSLSSSGSTNAVSKPSGPSSLAEEFGGFNETSGTSSMTLQWAPGTTFTDLALTGLVPLCLEKNIPKGCISPGLLKGLSPFTFKVTGNTSNGSQSLTGKAAAPVSTGTTQPVTVSKGLSGVSFAGLTVEYSFFGSKDKAAAKELTDKSDSSSQTATVKQYLDELASAHFTVDELSKCDVYNNWKAGAADDLRKQAEEVRKQAGSTPEGYLTDEQVSHFQQTIENEYRSLLTGMLKSRSCQSSLLAFRKLFAAILEAKTYDDFNAQQNASKKPEVALEYDLNTPQNKPSYSSAKATLNYSFGNPKKQVPEPPKKGDTASLTRQQNDIHDYASKQIDVLASATKANSSLTIQETTANAKPKAEANTAPWSLTVTGTADIYNSAPASSIPSSSQLRDIQAGAEIAYLFAPSDKSGTIRQLIGDVTAAAAYSYQDQTSPAILTGAALSDFTGLPSSTTTAYAQRGVIHLGQVRLGLGKGGNTNFPIAFTYSNRTELVVHPTWGLQFGISYNLTSLLGSSGASK
jgi:hypothetical protein